MENGGTSREKIGRFDEMPYNVHLRSEMFYLLALQTPKTEPVVEMISSDSATSPEAD